MARHYPPTFYEYFDRDPEYHQNRYANEATFVETAIRNPDGGAPRLLDVGCANGDFPRFMRARGFEVEGVEVSLTSKPITDFPVFRQEFPEIPVKEPRYNAVTAWAVLEHVHDPASYFAKASQVLLPGGVFVFLVTNFDSISSSRLYREDPPRHLYFFNENTVREYLDRAGFVMESADYSDKVYLMRPVNWLTYLIFFRPFGRAFTWKDAQVSRETFVQAHGLRPGLLANLAFAARHPFRVLDRILVPLYEKYQMASKKYGIVTFVARKRQAA